MAYGSQPAEGKKPGGKVASELLKTAQKRFDYCVDCSSENRPLQVEDLKFYAGSPDNGWQWPEKVKRLREGDPNGARPCLTINKLPHHVRQVTNELRLNKPAIKVLPVDDKSDPEIAEILGGVIRHIEYASDAPTAYQTANETQVVHGEGYWRVLTEYCDETSFDQDIYIRRIPNPFTVFMDPDGLKHDPAGSMCNYGFIVEDMPEDEFSEAYPSAKPIDWKSVIGNTELKHWYFDATKKVRIAEYFYFETEQKELLAYQLLQPEAGEQWVIGFAEDPQIKALPHGLVPAKKRTVQVRKVKWCKLTGQEVLEEREWPGKYIPIVRVVGNELDIEGNVIVSGLVRTAKDPMRMVNYWTSQEAEMLALAPKAPFIAASGQLEGFEKKWQEANIKNFAYLEYNPITEQGALVPAPMRQSPPIPPVGFLQAKAGALEDLKAVTGQFDASLGIAGNEKSGIAIRERKQEGDVSNYHYIDNHARGIRYTGCILVDLIPKIYDTKRIARILGEDGEPDQIAIDPAQQEPVRVLQEPQVGPDGQPQMGPDGQPKMREIGRIYNPTIGKYDVAVTVGPSFTTKRQEAMQAMSELVGANPDLWKVIGDLLVKNMDWPGSEEMAKRLRKAMDPNIVAEDDDGHPAVAALQSQVQQLTQMLEQVQAGFEAQKLEIEKVNAETKRFEAQSKDKERQFNAAKDYVDRTVADDTHLLAPGGAQQPAEPVGMGA